MIKNLFYTSALLPCLSMSLFAQGSGSIPEGAVEIPEGATAEEIEQIAKQAAADAATKAEAAQAPAKLDKEAFSYYFGFIAASELLNRSGGQGLTGEDFDFASYQKGFEAAISNQNPDLETFTQERLNAAMMGFDQLITERKAEENKRLGEVAALSEDWLKKNAQREGVIVTESGLQYEILEKGEGDPLGAMDNKDAKVLYEGKLPDGTVFDGNLESGNPVTFPLKEGALISGFTEALKLMPVGAHYMLYIPAELAYGEGGSPPVIPANCALQFELIVKEAVDAPLPQLPGAGGMPPGMDQLSEEQIQELRKMLEEQGAAPRGE